MLDNCPCIDLEWITCDGCELLDEPHSFLICEECGKTVNSIIPTKGEK